MDKLGEIGSKGLEPLNDPNKLRINTVIHTTIPGADKWPDLFNIRLVSIKRVDGERFFDARVEGDDEWRVNDIPEADLLRGEHDWMRFEGIIPQQEQPK